MEKENVNFEECNVCRPDFYCTRTADGRRYNFLRADEEIATIEHIADCPILREKVKFVEPETKLINSKTGETYDSL